MNKIKIIGLLILGGVIGGLLVWQIPQAIAIGTNIRSNTITGGSNTTATTSPTYLFPGGATATSSIISLKGSVENELLLQFTASNTRSTLNWRFQFSDDGIDWFEEDQTSIITGAVSDSTLLASIDHASSTVAHRWQPDGAASTSRKMIDFPTTNARFGRIVFEAVADRGSIWAARITGFSTPN